MTGIPRSDFIRLKKPSNSNHFPHGDVPLALCTTHPGWQSQPHLQASAAHPPPKLQPDTHNNTVTAVISLALSFFQDFGPGQVPGEPPVDWVEGDTIIVAIFIVVCVFQL